MRSKWFTYLQSIPEVDKSPFKDLPGLLASNRALVTSDTTGEVSRLELSKNYYVKRFLGKRNRRMHFLGAGRYAMEVKNLQYFSELGLSTPALVAHGYRSKAGLLDEAMIVTLEVEGASDLQELVSSPDFYTRGRQRAREVLRQLAIATASLHNDGFYHRDLKPRNVLVRYTGDEVELSFFDCPRGRRYPRFMLRRLIVRELAHIHKGLRGKVTRSDLMYAFKVYRGCEVLTPEDKAIAIDVLRYYRERRMTRSRRRRAQKYRLRDE